MFTFPVIGSLGDEQAREALEVPAEDEGVTWADSALQRVIEVTRGYPYFLQEFGKQAWNVAEGPDAITLEEVERSIPVATAELDDGFFRVRTGRTSDPERSYLRAMAELGPGPVRSGEVAELLAQEDDRARADPRRPAQERPCATRLVGERSTSRSRCSTSS